MKPTYELAVAFRVLDNPEAPGGKGAIPVYRGSKRNGTRTFTGRVNVVDKNHKAVTLWRASVVEACRPGGKPLVSPGLNEPLVVRYFFALRRPASVRRPYPSVKPDVDNLVKGTADAITDSGLWRDDALVISQVISKAYAGGHHPDGTAALTVPGCVVEIYRIMIPVT